jgi:anti-sigma B factor antagonist
MTDPFALEGALKIQANGQGQQRVLKVSGQLTESECPDFMAALKQESTSGTKRLVLDLDALNYISSAGLGALVSMHEALTKTGCRLILAGTNPKVRKLLTLTSLDRLIENADNVAEALKKP